MSVLAALLLAALTRSEIIERLRAVPITQVDGLVQVVAACPSDIRREFQMPIAGFVSDVCRRLYSAEAMKAVRFEDPGIVVRLGSVVSNVTDVVVETDTGRQNRPLTRIYLPSPRYADPERVRIATVQAFYRCVKHEEIDEETAVRRFRRAFPELRVDDEYAALEAWETGGHGSAEDEKYLRLARSILQPGVARPRDVLTFASRLYLYPPAYDLRFCGRYDGCSFREAIRLVREDPTIRLAAYLKTRELPIWGGGRGEAMDAAARACSDFLLALAAGDRPERELTALLDRAEDKLKGILE